MLWRIVGIVALESGKSRLNSGLLKEKSGIELFSPVFESLRIVKLNEEVF
jgi:hypothetical protein